MTKEKVKRGDILKITDTARFMETFGRRDPIINMLVKVTDIRHGMIYVRPSFHAFSYENSSAGFCFNTLDDLIEVGAITINSKAIQSENTRNTTNALCHQCKKPTVLLFGQQRYCPECER